MPSRTSEPQLPPSFRSRPASLDDIEAAVEFFNDCEIDESGIPDYDLEEVRADWADLDLAHNTQLVFDETDTIVASMVLQPNGQEGFGASGYVHPAFRGRGLGRAVVGWAETRAATGPWSGGDPVVLRNWISFRNPQAAELLGEVGFERTKRFMRMGIELEASPELILLPDGYTFRSLDFDNDLRGVHEVIEAAFSEHWSTHDRTYEEWKEASLGFGFDPRFWVQIFHGDDRVGAAIGQDLAGLGWIKAIGVLKSERGKGLGKALLLQELAAYWDAGLKRVELGVDSENVTSAVALYENAGMSIVNSYDAWEKKIPRRV